jgi:hypothetical protein
VYEQLVGSVCATVTVASRPLVVKCPVTEMTYRAGATSTVCGVV